MSWPASAGFYFPLHMKKTLKEVDLLTLDPHPKNEALYGVVPPGGFDPNLIKSLQKEVWPGDIQITTGNVIISGHRRIEHCAEGGVERGTVWVRDDLPEDPMSPEVLEALLEANLQRNKDEWTISQELKLWNEVEVLKSKKKASAAGKEAQSSPRPKGSADRTSPKKAEVPAIKKAAARMGLEEGERKLRQRVQAVQAVEKALEAGDTEKAEEVKKALNSSPVAAVRMAQAHGLIDSKPKKATPVAVEKKPEPEPLVLTGGEKLKAWWCSPEIPRQQLKNIETVMRPDIDYEDQELRPSPVAAKWIIENTEQIKKQQLLVDQLSLLGSVLMDMTTASSQMCGKLGRGPLHSHMRKVELHLKDSPTVDVCPEGYEAMLRDIEARAFEIVKNAHRLRYAYGWEDTVVWSAPEVGA